MGFKLYHICLWLILMGPPTWSREDQEPDEERGPRRQHKPNACAGVHPTARDIVRRFYAILPYFPALAPSSVNFSFDREHANTLFLHKYRAGVNSMVESDDVLDREGAFYAAVLTPLVFLQHYRDTWCLLERFQRALRLYQIAPLTEKRSALKLLQNLRAVNNKARTFIANLPGLTAPARTSAPARFDEREFNDKKNIRYLKELIKNLG